ncbi:MAG: O-antigen ligase family protein [Isosphaeraceae bacterium]
MEGQLTGGTAALGGRVRRAAEVVTLTMACLAPWAFGSVEAWAQLGLSLGVLALAMLGVVAAWLGNPRPRPGLAGGALAGLALLAVAQATPMPEGWLATVAPGTSVWRAGLIPKSPERVVGDDGPVVSLPSPTISQDPEASRHAAVRLAGAWVLLWTGAGLGGFGALRRFGLATAVNAAAMGLFALLQALTWNGRIYGLRASPQVDGWMTGGPFVCHSHLAAYLNLGLGFALGGLLTTRAGRPGRAARVGWSYLSALILVGLIGSHSRGGVLAATLAGLILAALSRPSRVWQVAWSLVVVGVAALILVVMGDTSPYRRMATVLDPDDRGYTFRIELWRSALGAWRDHPVLGCGLGTFAESAAPYFRRDHGMRFARAENETVDLLVEGGLMGLGLAAAGLIGIVRSSRRAWTAASSARDRGMVAGGAFGLLAILLHSVSDFALHVPGVATSAVLLVGHLAGSGGVGGDRRNRSRAWCLAEALTILSLATGFVVHDGRRALAEASLADSGLPLPGGTPKEEGRVEILVETQDPERLEQALASALRYRPDWAEGHLRRGLALLERYREQAARWVREGADPTEVLERAEAEALADPLWLHAVAHSASPEELEAVGGFLGQEPVVASLLPALRCFLEARRCAPGLARAHAGLASLDFLLADAEPGASYAARALRLAGGDATTAGQIARVGVQLGDLDLAAKGWRLALRARPDDWRPVADAAAVAFDPESLVTKVLPDDDARLALKFAESPGSESERPGARELFLRKALDCLASDASLSEAERKRTEAVALAGLGRRDEARAAMTAALAAAPSRDDWRGELVDWLIAWGKPAEARREALVGLHLAANSSVARATLLRAAEALANAAPVGADERPSSDATP